MKYVDEFCDLDMVKCVLECIYVVVEEIFVICDCLL